MPLNLNINLVEIRYLKITEIIDYKLVHHLEIQNDRSDEIHHLTEVYAITDRKTRHVKIP